MKNKNKRRINYYNPHEANHELTTDIQLVTYNADAEDDEITPKKLSVYTDDGTGFQIQTDDPVLLTPVLRLTRKGMEDLLWAITRTLEIDKTYPERRNVWLAEKSENPHNRMDRNTDQKKPPKPGTKTKTPRK